MDLATEDPSVQANFESMVNFVPRENRPFLSEMILSITRHKEHDKDTKYTHQFPVKSLSMDPRLKDTSSIQWWRWKETVQYGLNISLLEADNSVVWRMPGSGRLAFVKGTENLQAAIIAHQTAGKNIVDFYVVKSDGASSVRSGGTSQPLMCMTDLTNLPEMDQPK